MSETLNSFGKCGKKPQNQMELMNNLPTFWGFSIKCILQLVLHHVLPAARYGQGVIGPPSTSEYIEQKMCLQKIHKRDLK